MSEHKWPAVGEHLFGRWQAEKGLPNAIEYRVCLHPDCRAIERRPVPNA